jgi:hypothetical protein
VGGSSQDYAGLNTPATNAAYILDLSLANPAWKATSTPMTNPRVMGNAILLPNRQVVIVNGAATGAAPWLFQRRESLETQSFLSSRS